MSADQTHLILPHLITQILFGKEGMAASGASLCTRHEVVRDSGGTAPRITFSRNHANEYCPALFYSHVGKLRAAADG
jgi:hypothetical protein